MTISSTNEDLDDNEIHSSSIDYTTFADFPHTGDPEQLYIVKSENRIYRWDVNTETYICISSNYNEIMNIVSGNAH